MSCLYLCIHSDINWTWVDDETKERLGMQSKDDGEFWMSYKDFCRHFSEVTICLMGPDFDGDGISDNAGKIMLQRNIRRLKTMKQSTFLHDCH